MSETYNLDMQKIADTLEFDLEDVEMLVGVFLSTANDSLVELKRSIELNDKESIMRIAHSIKGSAANLTLIDISEVAKEIETGARSSLELNYEEKYNNLEKLIKSI